jgi:phosphoribosylpyrophosphate synthetase
VQVEIEENVRKQDVFVIQPTCAPSAENLMELLVLIDALKRASVASVTAVPTSATPARIAACVPRACRSPPSWRPTCSAPLALIAC